MDRPRPPLELPMPRIARRPDWLLVVGSSVTPDHESGDGLAVAAPAAVVPSSTSQSLQDEPGAAANVVASTLAVEFKVPDDSEVPLNIIFTRQAEAELAAQTHRDQVHKVGILLPPECTKPWPEPLMPLRGEDNAKKRLKQREASSVTLCPRLRLRASLVQYRSPKRKPRLRHRR